MSNHLEAKEQLVEQLIETASGRLSTLKPEFVERFAQRFYRFVPFSDLVPERHESLNSAALVMLQHVASYIGPEPKVVAEESHLREHEETVIAVLQPDSPFLLDSIRIELNRIGLPIRTILSVIMDTKRDEEGTLLDLSILDSTPGDHRETAICVITDPLQSTEERKEIVRAILDVLEDIRLAVTDFETMRDQASVEIRRLETAPMPFLQEDVEEAREFLEWMTENHFVFLGFDEHEIVERGGERILQPVANSNLGTMKRRTDLRPWVIDELPEDARNFVEARAILTFVNSTHRSRVHRHVYPQYVTVKRFDSSGQLVSACRFLGLFSSSAYSQSPFEIPMVRKKVEAVIERSEFRMLSHYRKALVGVLNFYPRDELFQAPEDNLFETAMAIVQVQESPQVRLFLRPNPYGRFYYCQVFVPKDRYHTELRRQIQAILCEHLGADDVEVSTHMGHGELGRIRFLIRVPDGARPDIDTTELERLAVDASLSWDDLLREEVKRLRGERAAGSVMRLYRGAFPAGYREHHSMDAVLSDLDSIDELDQGAEISLRLNHFDSRDQLLSLRLFHRDAPLPLSDILPILENLGLRTRSEHPYRIKRTDDTVWISQFELEPAFRVDADSNGITALFRDAFINIWRGSAANDGFNALILGGCMTWRDVAMFRAYARYNHQTQFGFGTAFTAETLLRHLPVACKLRSLFHHRFDPDRSEREETTGKLESEILMALNDVPSLNDDQVLRRFVDLIRATLRTNFFQLDEKGRNKPYLSLKLDPSAIPGIPLPRPAFEIFVYSPRMEGVHLRGGKIARGGLRWSDRPEDFRTEVLGLVKAQQVKNAVIVPVGAKGGFVCHQLPAGDRDAMFEEGKECYRTLLRGMLDLTDNLREGQVIPPPRLVRHDDDDPYLVVAADKGTATFSDIGNSISEAYGFWMGDAFASGGSAGYDHKKMGITAKGAWVSVQRHFCELGVDVQKEDISVIGIGDMSGDVFGNGMLRSKHIRLVAAFNHLHVFVDPDPDPQTSYEERKRLFEEARGWGNYDTSLLSAGGAIFSRQQKEIILGPQIRERFHIEAEKVTPDELISALLRAPVDLLWNGGIGTYVKASFETHAEVGDKANDSLRINADELGCGVIGEGGNLGLTQDARIEFCLKGGYCNTDFIDNSGGVDCSDHEVNLKIPLNGMLARGEITLEERNRLLSGMTDAVSALVLENNYRQVRAISLAQEQSLKRTVEYIRLLDYWERKDVIDRDLENLPDNETLTERVVRTRKGLTRPELSVLITYAKSMLKESLVESDITEDPLMSGFVEKAFPDEFVDRFREALSSHQLRREMIATQWANDLVNHLGPSYIYRIEESSGASPAEIARAYAVSREVFRMPDLWRKIEELDYQVRPEIQHRMMYDLARLVRRGSRWLVRYCRDSLGDVNQLVERFQPGVQQVAYSLRGLLHEAAREYWEENHKEFTGAGVPEDLAASIASSSGLFSSLGVILCSEETDTPIDLTARVYYSASDALDLHWLSYRIRDLAVTDHWQARARESFRDELHILQKQLTINILREVTEGRPEERIEAWLSRRQHFANRWKVVLEEFRTSGGGDYAMYPVAMRELAVISGQ